MSKSQVFEFLSYSFSEFSDFWLITKFAGFGYLDHMLWFEKFQVLISKLQVLVFEFFGLFVLMMFEVWVLLSGFIWRWCRSDLQVLEVNDIGKTHDGTTYLILCTWSLSLRSKLVNKDRFISLWILKCLFNYETLSIFELRLWFLIVSCGALIV